MMGTDFRYSLDGLLLLAARVYDAGWMRQAATGGAKFVGREVIGDGVEELVLLSDRYEIDGYYQSMEGLAISRASSSVKWVLPTS